MVLDGDIGIGRQPHHNPPLPIVHTLVLEAEADCAAGQAANAIGLELDAQGVALAQLEVQRLVKVDVVGGGEWGDEREGVGVGVHGVRGHADVRLGLVRGVDRREFVAGDVDLAPAFVDHS
jgi:hypothetical protein